MLLHIVILSDLAKPVNKLVFQNSHNTQTLEYPRNHAPFSKLKALEGVWVEKKRSVYFKVFTSTNSTL